MAEIKDCLPPNAVSHFISLRNIRLETEQRALQKKLAELRAKAAARGSVLSGGHQLAEWELKKDFQESLAIGYMNDALETCSLYDIKITRAICDCLMKALQELLAIQYKHALQAQAQGIADVKIPLSVRAQMGNSPRFPAILNRVQVMLERARVEDEKARSPMANKQNDSGNTYHQTIHHHGQGPLNATQTGDVYIQQQSTTIEQLQSLISDLAQVRTALKAQDSLDTDEGAGLVAAAEKAAAEGNESKVVGFLRQIPGAALDVVKSASSAALLAFLRAHGIAV